MYKFALVLSLGALALSSCTPKNECDSGEVCDSDSVGGDDTSDPTDPALTTYSYDLGADVGATTTFGPAEIDGEAGAVVVNIREDASGNWEEYHELDYISGTGTEIWEKTVTISGDWEEVTDDGDYTLYNGGMDDNLQWMITVYDMDNVEVECNVYYGAAVTENYWDSYGCYSLN